MQTLERPFPAEDAPDRPPLLQRPLLSVFRLDWEVAVWVALLGVGLALRLWDLGSRAQHHDESLHAVYSYYLYIGKGYVHDPLMHGPFQFHAVALIYLLFGDSDFTARVLPAILGTVCVGLPYFLKPYLGRTGALCAAALICFSPTLLYYSRFIRNDIYIAAWNLMLVIGIFRFMSTGRRVYALLAAVALALGFATKEVTYLTVVSIGSYLFITSLPELLRRLPRLDFATGSNRLGITILVGTLVLPQGAAAMDLVWGLHPDFSGLGSSVLGAGLSAVARGWATLWGLTGPAPDAAYIGKVIAGGVVVLVLMAVGAFLGRRWHAPLWTQAAVAFYVIFTLLYTTFFTNIAGFGSGIWGSLEYWLQQHSVQRGAQPWYYYLMLLPVYEFLPLGLSLAGWAYYAVRRRALALREDYQPLASEFTWFLLWWFFTSLVLYSFAGEKMPWLNVHMALPLTLMAGKVAGRFIDRMPWRSFVAKGGVYFVLLVAIVPFALKALWDSASSVSATTPQIVELLQAAAAICALAFLVGTAWQLSKRLEGRTPVMGVALVVLSIAGVMTLRAAWQLSYAHGDIPVEELVYTQTSPEIPRAMRNIDLIAAQTGQREELPVTIDAAEGFTWPWAWYLRHYKNVDYPDLTNRTVDPRGSVLVINANNLASVQPVLDRYEPGVRVPLRWWFPENYDFGIPRTELQTPNGRNLEALFKDLTDLSKWGPKLSYFYSRALEARLGSSDAIIYYPKGSGVSGASFTAGGEPSAPSQPAPPASPLAADLQLAGPGAPANLLGPRGVAVDSRGFVYIVDSRREAVIKVDPSGQVVARVTGSGQGDGQFKEPWGVAVDKDGYVYVADTWNHRIQKFDQDLRFVAKWGSFGEVPNGQADRNTGVFYGPRSIAIDKDGSLYVTDTGNKRVIKFSPDGRVLAVYGNFGRDKGQFSEPVGITIAPNGEFLVADTWNRRVQRFNANFQYVGEFPVLGWSGIGLNNKPYIAADPDGNILVTDPDSNRLLRYSSTGVLMNVFGKFGSDLSSLNTPSGIAIDAQGRIFVDDAGNSRVLRFPPPPP